MALWMDVVVIGAMHSARPRTGLLRCTDSRFSVECSGPGITHLHIAPSLPHTPLDLSTNGTKHRIDHILRHTSTVTHTNITCTAFHWPPPSLRLPSVHFPEALWTFKQGRHQHVFQGLNRLKDNADILTVVLRPNCTTNVTPLTGYMY